MESVTLTIETNSYAHGLLMAIIDARIEFYMNLGNSPIAMNNINHLQNISEQLLKLAEKYYIKELPEQE